MQDNSEEYLKLISRLSSVKKEDRTESGRSWEKLSQFLNTEAAAVIEDSTYPKKSVLKAKIDNALDDAQLFLREPYLYGKPAVGVLGGKAASAEASFLHQLLNSYIPYELCLQRSLPCTVYKGERVQTAAVGKSGSLIPLDMDEYSLMLELYKQKLRMDDLAAEITFSLPDMSEGYNLIRFPWYAQEKEEEYIRLAGLCSIFFILWDSEYPDRYVPRSVTDQEVPIIIAVREEDGSAVKFAEELRSRIPGVDISVKSIKECASLMEKQNGIQYNFTVGNRIFAALLKLLAYEKSEVKRHAANIENLQRSAVFVENLQNTLDEIRSVKSAQKNRELKNIERLTDVLKETETLLQDFENTLLLQYPSEVREMLKSGKSAASQQEMYSEEEVLFVIGSFENSNSDQSNEDIAMRIVRSLTERGFKYAALDNLWLLKARGQQVPENMLNDLMCYTGKDIRYMRAVICFAEELKISDKTAGCIASQIPANTADELYYLAYYTEYTSGNTAKTVSAYEEAFEGGSRKAGEWLTDHYFGKAEDKINLSADFKTRKAKKLADSLIPRAARYYGMYCILNQKRFYRQGITYLRIAAALGDIPAIRFYAGYLFEQRGSDDKETVYAALELYKYMDNHNIAEENLSDKIGILYYRCKDYVNAKKWLQKKHKMPEAAYLLGSMYYSGTGSTAKNPAKAQELLGYAASNGNSTIRKNAKQKLQNIEKEKEKRVKKLAEQKKTEYKKTATYSSHTVSSSSSDDCFITTAVCGSEGKSDNCEELTAFRRFRDTVLKKTPEGQALIKEYYRIAPEIVKCISREPDAAEIYHYLYEKYIEPGYLLLMQGKQNEAKRLYAEGVLRLAKKYGVEVSVEGFELF